MNEIKFEFDEVKATQAAARLVSNAGGQMSHLKLVKLLYIIDREAFARWGRPVSGGSYYSLPLGPVTSEILDRMRVIEGLEDESPTFWLRHLTKIGNEMRLKADMAPPGTDELSPAEIELIDEIAHTYRELTRWETRDRTHEFGEYDDPHGSRRPIAVEDILRHVGETEEEISELRAEAEHLRQVDSMIGG